MAGMRKAYESAYLDLQGQQYPYMLLDQSQKGQLSPYRLFTNIFDRFPICYSVDGMKAYVIGAQDFELFFDVFSDKEKFTANERTEHKTKPKAVCPTKKSAETKKSTNVNSKRDEPKIKESEKETANIEWGSDSEWGSDFESTGPTELREPTESDFEPTEPTGLKRRSDSPDQSESNRKRERSGDSVDERELIRRRFEETLY